MFRIEDLHTLENLKACAAGSLEAIVFVMLTNHEAGLAISAGDWLRLRRAYYAHEDANAAVRDYCLNLGEGQ
jgi:hypothetical protein